ncbi:cobyrinic acid aC-diamide synthase CobB [Mycobacterium tuberculosis]|nr:cobyrinic acid aC-diamide synthase CobB [Mycobacterium tuberculosis]
MLGLIPGKVVMQPKLAALGLREITGTEGNFLFQGGDAARGHEFHYSEFVPQQAELAPAYETKGLRGMKKDGCLLFRTVAGYTHLHFASNPQLVVRWLKECEEYRLRAVEL